MKKIAILSIMMLLFLGKAYGQGAMATYDAKADMNSMENLAKTAKQLKEARSQTQRLSGIKEDMSKSLQFLETVNKHVKEAGKIKQIINRQKLLYDRVFQMKKTLGKSKHREILLLTEQMAAYTLKKLKEDVVEIMKITSDKIFKMSDNDRLRWIESKEKEINDRFSELEEKFSMLKQANYVLNL